MEMLPPRRRVRIIRVIFCRMDFQIAQFFADGLGGPSYLSAPPSCLEFLNALTGEVIEGSNISKRIVGGVAVQAH